MKKIVLVVASLFAIAAFAQDKGQPVYGKTTPNPVIEPVIEKTTPKAEVKKDAVKPVKSNKPAVKNETKATTATPAK